MPGRAGQGHASATRWFKRLDVVPGVTVRRLARGTEDGYRSGLLPGLKSSEDAERLAEELAFAVSRLEAMESEPVGLWAEIADPAADLEERTWLAFLVAYLAPLEDEQPFAAIDAARVSWASGEMPALDGVATGPRSAYHETRGTVTIEAYRAWAARAGSQAAAFTGEDGVDARAAVRARLRTAVAARTAS